MRGLAVSCQVRIFVAVLVCQGCRPSAFDELSSGTERERSDAGMDGGGDPADGSDPFDAGGGFDGSVDASSDEEAGSSPCGDTTSDPEQCGACTLRCVPPEHGFATCERSVCREHRLVITEQNASALHGGAGGSVFPSDQLCANGEVMIGLSGKADDAIMYALAVHCARVAIEPNPTGYEVRVVPGTKAPELGGLIDPVPPSYELLCPEGSVVTAVAGATWLWPGAATISVRQLSLTCSRLSVNANGQAVLMKQDGTLKVGDQESDSALPFSEVCDQTRVVAGLSGRYGAYIDAVAVHCGLLELEERGGKTVARDE
jgi:hypothetical protein